MSVASSLFSSISGYIPTAVKEAAGLSPQISEAVRHLVHFLASYLLVEQWTFRAPGCLGDFFGGIEKLPSYIGIIIDHYKDPYEPTRIQWKVIRSCRSW